MNIGFDSVLKAIKLKIPNIFVTNNQLIGLSESIEANIISSSNPELIPLTNKWKVDFELDSSDLQTKYGDITQYKGIINEWNSVSITKITNSVSGKDIITCEFVNEIFADINNVNYEQPTKIFLFLNEMIYCNWEYYNVSSNLGSRYYNLARGLKIDVTVKTKDDSNCERIDGYIDSIIDLCNENFMNIKIKETVGMIEKTVGNFKVLNKPYVTRNIVEGENIQSRTVTIIGYYMVNYKK